MTMLGADPDELDRLAADIEHFAERLHGHGATLHAQLHSTSWIGHIADEFREEWDRLHHVAILGAFSSFQSVVNAIRHQAEAQRKASAPDPSSSQPQASPGSSRSAPGGAGGEAEKAVQAMRTFVQHAVESLRSALPPFAGNDAELAAFKKAYGPPRAAYLSPYDEGQCTSWAVFRRHELGLKLPRDDGNNNGWEMAGNLGLSPDGKPHPGALASYSTGKYGHVMVVESVSSDGNTVTVSEMNYDGSAVGATTTPHLREATLVRNPDGTWAHYSDTGVRWDSEADLKVDFSNVDKA